jgi:hypothetical protein
MSTELTKVNKAQIAHQEQHPIDKIKQDLALIQQLMKEVLTKDVDYGIIPGIPKPILLKPGAEKLCATFKLRPSFETTVAKKEVGGHINVTSICKLYNLATNECVGESSGISSTLETKHRYRYESLGEPIPGDYWNNRINPPGKYAKKIDGKWVWAKRVENKDIADTYNTVVKMGEKRAFVGAALYACCASGLFSQDLEDSEPESAPKKPVGNTKKTSDKKTADEMPF